MSLADFDERDLDRLADYLAGELPVPAAAEVERLLRTEPAWSQAYAELSGADAQIQALLRADGRSQIDPMPADVIARVDAALAGAASPPGSRSATATDGPAPRATPPSGANVAFLDAQRRRRRQWLGTAAAVIVGIGLCTGAVTVLRDQSWTGAGASTAAGGVVPQNGKADDNAAQPPSPPRGYSPAPQAPASSPTRLYGITQSGIDYTPETLRTLPTREALSGDNHEFSGGAQPPAPSPTLLPNGLDACLVQVTAVHPGTVASVDYARYESQPAVIIVIQRPSGPIVVAAGAKCGAPGPDELAAVAG